MAQLPAFSGLSTAGLLALICRSQVTNMNANQNVITTGDIAESMYVILEGQCQVVVENEVVAKLNNGEIFGEMGLMFQHHRPEAKSRSFPQRQV